MSEPNFTIESNDSPYVSSNDFRKTFQRIKFTAPDHKTPNEVTTNYTVRDPQGNEATAEITFNIIPLNDPPVITSVEDQDGTVYFDNSNKNL